MKRYLPNTIQALATSELRCASVDEVTDDMLFIVSQDAVLSTDTDFGSRNFTYGELTAYLSSQLSVPSEDYSIGNGKNKLTSLHFINGIYSGFNDYNK